MRFFFIILLLCSCSSRRPEDFKSKEYSYSFEKIGWRSIDPQGADKAYMNEERGSVIMVNSLCRKYDSTGLEVLSNNFLGGLTELEVLQKNSITYKDREAYSLQSKGKLDGVTVFLNSLTSNRNHCTFDFVLISPLKVSEADLKTYQELLENIKFN
ncbi:MAG: hypothetical protein ACOYL6_09210 [Bacteriovoracaceae bacterium]